jgi:hypothetical protein
MHAPEDVQEEENKHDDDVWDGVYEYDISTNVMIKPTEGSGEQFWLGTVVAHGPGGGLGDYEIWWLKKKITKKHVRYLPEYLMRHPRKDVVTANAIQCSVGLTTSGRIKKISQRRIQQFVNRWEHQAAGDDPHMYHGSDGEQSLSEPP